MKFSFRYFDEIMNDKQIICMGCPYLYCEEGWPDSREFQIEVPTLMKNLYHLPVDIEDHYCYTCMRKYAQCAGEVYDS